jgi:Ribulose-phosphate 3 epimerase family
VAVSPGTSASAVQAHGEAARLGVLVMSVEPGRAGSTFDLRTPDRVREVGGRRLLGVDGAVTSDRVPDLVRAGASWVVSGTDLLRSPDPAGWLSRVRTPGSDPTGRRGRTSTCGCTRSSRSRRSARAAAQMLQISDRLVAGPGPLVVGDQLAVTRPGTTRSVSGSLRQSVAMLVHHTTPMAPAVMVWPAVRGALEQRRRGRSA